MSELFIIRHAQASFGSENYDQLSELGHQQSEWLGEYLARREIHFDHVILGDMVRHRETLEGLQKGLANHKDFATLNSAINNASVLSVLNEFDFKAIANAFIAQHPEKMPPGKPTKNQYYQLFKQALYLWQADELNADLPESFNDFSQRVKSFLQLVKDEYADKNILVITSGGAISKCVSEILETPNHAMIELNLQIRNSSITQCYFNQEKIRLHSFNEVPHLESTELRQYITFS